MAQRLTYRTRLSYNTPSNRVKVVKTPGGTLRHLRINKKAGAPKCGDCGEKLFGLPSLRPTAYKRLSKNQKNVSRAYGGSRCAQCVRQRIVRAFLLEEQKIVKRVLKSKSQPTPAVAAAADEKAKAVKAKAADKKAKKTQK
jgi:large subunit ribosomal protein L34e